MASALPEQIQRDAAAMLAAIADGVGADIGVVNIAGFVVVSFNIAYVIVKDWFARHLAGR